MSSVIQEIVNTYAPVISKLDEEITAIKALFSKKYSEHMFLLDEIGDLRTTLANRNPRVSYNPQNLVADKLRMMLLEKMAEAYSTEIEKIGAGEQALIQKKLGLVIGFESQIDIAIKQLLSEVASDQLLAIHEYRPETVFVDFDHEPKQATPEGLFDGVALKKVLTEVDTFAQHRTMRK
jgi:Mg2+ and Co2+ transporter CorA